MRDHSAGNTAGLNISRMEKKRLTGIEKSRLRAAQEIDPSTGNQNLSWQKNRGDRGKMKIVRIV